MPKTSVDGQTIHYVESSGDGPTLVLVHSSGLNHRQWSPLRLALRATPRLLVPDLPGYGKSMPWEAAASFTMDDDVAAVSAVIEQAEQPVLLVGHSYGGYLAMRAALRAPERVSAILIHEPVIWGVFYGLADEEKIREIERANADGLFLSEEHGGKERWWRRFIEIWGGEGAWDALPIERREAFLAVGPKVFAEVRALLLDRTPVETWAQLKMPMVVTVGRGTQPLEADACHILDDAMPNVGLVEIPGGHMGPITAAGAFAAALEDLAERVAH